MRDVTEQVEEAKEQIEAIEPSTGARRLQFNLVDYSTGQQVERVYIQEELGFFPKQQFMTLITDELNKFVKGEYGVKIGQLFRGELRQMMPTEITEETVQRTFDENAGLIQAFIELVNRVPGLQQEIIALSLGVPVRGGEQEWFKAAIQEPPSRGGLTDDDGFDILIHFIRQNAKALRRFFEEKATELVKEFRIQVLGEEFEEEKPEEPTPTPTKSATDSPGSTPSTTSSPATPVSV